MTTLPRAAWQAAGALALAHVVLIPVGIWLQAGPLLSEGRAGITRSYVEGDLTRTFTGGVLEALGFLLMVPVVALLGRVLGRSGETARWAAQTGVLCGIGYVTVTFAVGFPAGAAAMYGAQHGLDVDAAYALNNVRIFGYVLSLMLLGGMTIGYALAALADRTHVRWFGGFGLVSGVLLLVSTPLAGLGQQDWGTLVWLVWFVGVGVLMLRHREPERAAELVPERARIRHS